MNAVFLSFLLFVLFFFCHLNTSFIPFSFDRPFRNFVKEILQFEIFICLKEMIFKYIVF